MSNELLQDIEAFIDSQRARGAKLSSSRGGVYVSSFSIEFCFLNCFSISVPGHDNTDDARSKIQGPRASCPKEVDSVKEITIDTHHFIRTSGGRREGDTDLPNQYISQFPKNGP